MKLNVKAIVIPEAVVGAALFILCRLAFAVAPEATLSTLKYLTPASERLSDDSSHWFRVATNYLLTITRNLEIKVELMDIERHGSTVLINSSSPDEENRSLLQASRG